MSPVTGSCHCGAVAFQVEEPEQVLDCNCSRCRLYGGLWAYYPQRDVQFARTPDTVVYMWGDRTLEFHHCRTCGCATHSTLAGETDAARIAVNVIDPGWIDTPGERAFFTEAQIRDDGARLPWGRIGTPDDIAAAAAFLASAEADYVTGTVLRVDGGLALVR